MYNAVLAQANSNQNLQLPTIIPPSPTAQNFMRYGEIPVDYSTGVPKIEIPIYTIKGKQLELPISISYHASGIKVYDIASEVGLGWVLNAGGIVSRTVFDAKDENGATSKTYSDAEQFLTAVPIMVNSNYNSNCSTYLGVNNLEMYLDARPGEDLISDRFFYKLPNGMTGVFRYSYPQNDTLIMLPYRPYKIDKTIVVSQYDGKSITEFKITDDKGTLYVFQRFQDSSESSEWFLKEMISNDGTEHIKLTYIPQQPTPCGMPSDSFTSPKQYIIDACNSTIGEPSTYMGGTGGTTNSVILSSIESDDIIINFSYADRQDFQYLKKITDITIASKIAPNDIKKKITFNQSYFGNIGYENTNNMDKRLKLNSMAIYGENNLNAQTYSFTYEQSQMLPSYISRSFDFWGYYNGSNNGTAIPNNFLPVEYQNSFNGAGYGGDRKADNGYFSKACILNEIIYPSGGKTKFDFERGYVDNLYRGISGGGYIGGFRVSKITNYSNNNEIANIKSYQYLNPQFNIIDPEFYSYPQWYIDLDDPNHDFVNCNGIGGCWKYYKESIITSNPIVSHDLMPGMPIAYTSVIEYDGGLTDNVGSTEYSYSFPDVISYTDLIRELHTYQNDRGNYEPKLEYKVIKTRTGNKSLEEWYAYSDHFEQEFNTGINITRTLNYLAKFKNVDLSELGCHNCVVNYIQSIKAHDTKAFQKANLLDYSIKRTYNQNDDSKYVEDRVDYTYNQHNLMINQTSGKNSLGENIVTKYKYPYDFGTNQPYQTMLSKNILTPVVEQVTTNENKQVQKIETSYKDWGNNIIEPEIIKAQTASQTPLENKIRYLSYDGKGNPVSVKKEKGNPVTYLWGYDKTLPIAMVENAAYVYQSSTEDQSQQISYSGLQINPGNTSYELGNITISEEKNYPVERSYERDYSQSSVVYQVVFQNDSNSAYNVTFTDTAPTNQNSLVVETSVNLKPGTYTVKLVNVGYNGYTGKISHDININVKNIAGIKKETPFHTSFEDDMQNVNTSYSITGKKSHVGSYIVKIPPSSMGLNKVIVSYWGKASASSEWKYVETILDANGQNYTVGSSDAYVDEVRLYPVDAMMTTYTYDPFYKQLTSVMKPNNQAEYYIYDKKGRLERIIDINGKILKEYQYNYKQ